MARTVSQPGTHKRLSTWQRLRSGNLSETQLAWLLLLPALITLVSVMLYPILNVVWRSLRFERLNQPARGTPFVGLDNFVSMLWGREMTWSLTHLWLLRLGVVLLMALVIGLMLRGRVSRRFGSGLVVAFAAFFVITGFHPGEGGRWNDPRFWNSFRVTWTIILISVPGAFLAGLPLALIANLETRWRWLVRASLLVPWAMPRVFVGVMFAWIFNSSRGVVNDLLARIGIAGPLWLSRTEPALAAVNMTIVWTTSAFVALILLAGLQSIDHSLYEAATVDGANAWQRFWNITLPLLRPAIAVALIFRTLTAFQEFDIPYAMTAGGPGRSLEVIGLYIQRTTLNQNIGYAAALSVALFLMSLAITIMYLRWIYRED